MKAATLLLAISAARSHLRKSEKKVADFVLDNAPQILNCRIADLAEQAGVSEPTVIRFCRAININGFQEFKLQLAQDLASSPGITQFSSNADDPVDVLNLKVFDSTIGSLLKVRDDIDSSALQQAINALCKARRVEFYGFGASAAIASDAQHKFFRLQVSSAAYSDPHIQHMSALSLTENDVVVAISQSGRTKDLLHSVKLVIEAGATAIGLAPDNTPLTDICTIPIHINVEENTNIFTPVASRIAHLVVIDVLAMGVAQVRQPLLEKYLSHMNESLDSLRVSNNNESSD